MAGKPVATVTGMHICPMVTGVVPHVGGPIIGPGTPNILINNKPAAVMGDMVTCAGPPDVIVMGNPSVLFNGKPVACMGDMTAHGGTITIGEPNVMIGVAAPEAGSSIAVKEIKMTKITIRNSVIMPVKEIPFPEITLKDKLMAKVSGNGKSLKEAEENEKAIKEQENSIEKMVVNHYLTDKNSIVIDCCNIGEEVFLVVETKNLEGEKMNIKLKSSNVDFEYNGKRLEKHTLENYTIRGATEKIPLKVLAFLDI